METNDLIWDNLINPTKMEVWGRTDHEHESFLTSYWLFYQGILRITSEPTRLAEGEVGTWKMFAVSKILKAVLAFKPSWIIM